MPHYVFLGQLRIAVPRAFLLPKLHIHIYNMSTTAKATLAASILFCVGSVVGVHYIQLEEKVVSFFLKN